MIFILCGLAAYLLVGIVVFGTTYIGMKAENDHEFLQFFSGRYLAMIDMVVSWPEYIGDWVKWVKSEVK